MLQNEVFYIILVELCRIKLLILSLPVGQSALMNKSGILFNITLKRCKGINTNLCQIHCNKKKKNRQLVLKNLVLQLIIITYLYSIYFVNTNIHVLQNDFTRISLEEASCLIATEGHCVSQDLHDLMCSERNSYVMLLFTAVRMKFKLGATTEFNGKFCNTQSISIHAV